MKITNAKDYIELLDGSGESWSNDNEALANAMEDYAKIYHENQVKNVDKIEPLFCEECKKVSSKNKK